MKGLLIRWAVSAASLILTAEILPGIEIRSIFYGILSAAVLGVLNAVLRPVLIILTLPVNILSLGLFTLVINGFMLYLAGGLLKGLHIAGFGWAMLGALIMSVIGWLLNTFIRDDGKMGVIDLNKKGNGKWST